jgi:hypothetical protein
MRGEGDLPALPRLRIRPDRAPVRTAALWRRAATPAGHIVGAWPSATPPDGRRNARRGGLPRLSRCRALDTPCAADPCRCPRYGTPGQHTADGGTGQPGALNPAPAAVHHSALRTTLRPLHARGAVRMAVPRHGRASAEIPST